MRFAASEFAAGRLASSNVMSRLSETLLVEAVRQYSASLADADSGWMNGIKDPQIGRALALIHRDIALPWSAESLAKKSPCRAAPSPIASRRSSGCRRSAISRSGGCRPRNLICARCADHRQGRARRRLRIRGGSQPRLQARVRRVSGAVARRADRCLTFTLLRSGRAAGRSGGAFVRTNEASAYPPHPSCQRASGAASGNPQEQASWPGRPLRPRDIGGGTIPLCRADAGGGCGERGRGPAATGRPASAPVVLR